MPVISHSLQLVYFDIPKVGCTTLKTLLWEIDHGTPFRRWTDLSFMDRLRRRLWLDRSTLANSGIHYQPGYRTWSYDRAQSLDIPEGYARLTVLRDPIARIFSAWTNKMTQAVFAARDEEEDLRNEGLPTMPGFGEFIERFEEYCRFSRPVRVHTYPYRWHLGPDLGAYDAVFRLEDGAALESYLSARQGAPVTMGRRNRTTTFDRDAQLTPSQTDRLVALTRDEYAWTGGLYDQQAGLDRFLSRLSVAA